jgi:hypothetical protein
MWQVLTDAEALNYIVAVIPFVLGVVGYHTGRRR